MRLIKGGLDSGPPAASTEPGISRRNCFRQGDQEGASRCVARYGHLRQRHYFFLLVCSGIAAVYAGALAPLALLLAAGVLYLYKKIYTEVVEALPLDGGVYNCLLNCTRKFDAFLAASSPFSHIWRRR